MNDEFDLWYYGEGDDKGYPRKEARGEARKAFTAARKIASLDELIEGRKRYAKEKHSTERQYLKLPATWLRAECWADLYEADPNPFSERLTATQALDKANETYPKLVEKWNERR